jgi:hypothetical protein
MGGGGRLDTVGSNGKQARLDQLAVRPPPRAGSGTVVVILTALALIVALLPALLQTLLGRAQTRFPV